MKHLLDREARQDAIAEVFTGLCVTLTLLAILLWVYG
jgi:hypothetical protein